MDRIELPDTITELSEANFGGVDCAECYVEAEHGFRLSDQARRQMAEHNAELERVEAEAAAALADAEAEIKAKGAKVRELEIGGAIRSALVECSVPVRQIPMVLPFLEKKFADCDGETDIGRAVASWLASAEGEPFQPKRATHETPGPLTAAIRRLRAN